MAAVSMLMSGRFHRLLFTPVVLGDFAVLDRAGFHQLHSAFRASARLAGNHLGMLDHRTRIKWRRDGNRVGLGLGYWRRLHYRDQRHAALWTLARLGEFDLAVLGHRTGVMFDVSAGLKPRQ